MQKQFLLSLLLLSAFSLHAESCCKPTTKAPATKETVTPITKVERTYAMIKPEAVQKGLTGEIIKLIEQNGFNIIRMEKRTLTKKEAETFYAEHKGRPFYNNLVAYITSGPVITLMLEKENAIADWRALLGATDPAQANMGTVRKMFAESKSKNAAHGSDSAESAKREISFIFG